MEAHQAHQAQVRLAQRWAEIRTPELGHLRDFLLKFSALAIADFEDGGVLAAKRFGADGNHIGDWWYLPAPLQRDYIIERLAGRFRGH